MAIDVTRLERVRHTAGGKTTARCPACGEDGGDRKGTHLVIFPDGKFACAAHPGDGDHRKRIAGLAGLPSSGSSFDREQWQEWRLQKINTQQRRLRKDGLDGSSRQRREEIIRRYGWPCVDVWEDSPQRIDCDLVEMDAAYFLRSLFSPGDLLWTGEVHHSGGEQHAKRWKRCAEWSSSSSSSNNGSASLPLGPMTTPAVWMPGTVSRSSNNVLKSPYVVLDFDGFDGIKPTTPEELDRHVLDSLAIIRWLREGMDWELAAILWTGGKSLHAWFHTPPSEVLESLLPVAKSLGMDAGLIGRPEHPCRLPGQVHQKSGKVSRVMWLRERSE